MPDSHLPNPPISDRLLLERRAHRIGAARRVARPDADLFRDAAVVAVVVDAVDDVASDAAVFAARLAAHDVARRVLFVHFEKSFRQRMTDILCAHLREKYGKKEEICRFT